MSGLISPPLVQLSDILIEDMASQSASQDQNDSSYQQNAASKFSSYQQNSQGVDGILGQMATDKGLANYDKNDELETALKDYINSNKDAMAAVNNLIQNNPALASILGPSEFATFSPPTMMSHQSAFSVVYEIKCIVDDLLDITENLTDGLLNSLQPLLTGLSGNAGSMTCSSQLKALGFCL